MPKHQYQKINSLNHDQGFWYKIASLANTYLEPNHIVSNLQYPILDYKLSDMQNDFKICRQGLKDLGFKDPEVDLTHYTQQSQLLFDLIITSYTVLESKPKICQDQIGSMREFTMRINDLRRSASFLPLPSSDQLETILTRLSLNYDRTLMEINRLSHLNKDQLDLITFTGFDVNRRSMYQQYSGIANLAKFKLPEIMEFKVTQITFGTFQDIGQPSNLMTFLQKHRNQLSQATLIFKQKIKDSHVLEDFMNSLDKAKILYEMTNYTFAYFKFDLSLISLRCQHVEKPENQCSCGYESFSEYLNRLELN